MKKKLDSKNRWRNKKVGFRMSEEEAAQLNAFVKLSGLSKQEYLISRVLQKEITVVGNPRVYKALRNLLEKNLTELERFTLGYVLDSEQLDLIRFMSEIIYGLKGEEHGK